MTKHSRDLPQSQAGRRDRETSSRSWSASAMWGTIFIAGALFWAVLLWWWLS